MATSIDSKIEALEEAIESGARKITFRSGGTLREVEYRNMAEMISALARLQAKKSPPRRVTLVAL